MAKVDISRVGAGTIELVRDATTGAYSLKNVGFETIDKLSIPDIKTTATTTKTTTDPKTATDITGQGIGTQTQMAFQMPGGDGDKAPDTTGSMLQQAEKTSKMLSDTFSRPNMRDVAGDRITSPLDIQSPTERVFDRPNMRDVAGDRRISAEEAAPQENILSDVSLKDPSVTSANVQRGVVEAPGINFDFLKGDRFKQGTASTNPVGGVDQIAADAITRQEMISGATADDPTANQLGVRAAKPAETALDMDRFEGVSRMGTLADKDVKDVKPVKRNALETVSTSLRTTGDSILSKIKTPTMMVLDAIMGPETASNKFDKKYFNVREDGKIAGNPSRDLYAGINNISAFGNKVQYGNKRIATREKTISRKGYKPGDKFYDDTQNMKDQQKDYINSRNNDPGINPSKAATVSRTDKDFGQFGRKQQSDAAGASGGKIVCTMMNESYGFGSFRNKIWLRHSKNLAPEYQIGYHKIFLPLVKKSKTNKIIKKILEHIAIHRTIDIRQEERNKVHLTGRLYRKILEPICYWVGKI